LPQTAFTRSGIEFRPTDDVWMWTDGPFRVHIDYRRLPGNANLLKDSLKRTLLVFAKSGSAHHLCNLFQAFMHFLVQRDASTSFVGVTPEEVSDYAARLGEHEKGRLSTLNVLLQKWNSLGFVGVTNECAQYLRERRKPGNRKGEAVRTRDPVEGPFSEAEYTALYRAVDTAYGKGHIPMWVAILTRLLFACGGRVSQYASLKVKDLQVRTEGFLLMLPQVKNGEVHSRVSLKEFALSPQTGRFTQDYIDQLLTGNGRNHDAALFPTSIVMQGPVSEDRPEGSLFYGHCTAAALSKKFGKAMEEISPPTERLGLEPIPVASKRFRYTFGTRMAEEGASKAVIADRLGHVDLQNVDVYFEASPKIVDNIDRAMDAGLAPLARAFKGRLVEDEAHSTHKGAPGSRIIDFRVSKDPIGSCGRKAEGCFFDKPVACYTCFKFEPWLDAPHEKVLERLRKERQSYADDERLAQINDDALRAVQEVMAECTAVRAHRMAEDRG
jgi:integrase